MPVLRRISSLVAIVVLGSLIVPEPAGAHPGPVAKCEINRLAEPVNWSMSIVTGVDPSGRYVAGRGYPADPWSDLIRYPVIWDGGVPTAVPIPGIDQNLNDVNSAGVAVGTSYDPDSWEPLSPWAYVDGRLRPLPGVESGDASGINEHGAVSGNRADGVPVWWPSPTSDPRKLPSPDGALWVRTFDIDDDGTIVGVFVDRDDHDRGIAWLPDGTFTVLSPPAGLGPATAAFNIRNGWISGWAGSPTGPVTVRWHLRSGATDVIPQFRYVSVGVNAAGWLAGSGMTGSALLVSDTGDLSLPGLVDEPDDIALGLSDSGRVIGGQATDKEGQLRAVRWICG
ncbi:hypothetical protein [Virgisporangium aurantiacum]|uniref:Uncharacterized protein n=1 Tax=Virgisporangium aurantiacum TaxID=175570 RepID=A0A8J4E0U9_9ACTN|nr:hypothetical protein [Virgisporangium aurantiacum]GIJ57324.1 hypothetical protein Vau01_048400 [Virgisporangium aurantiacum]